MLLTRNGTVENQGGNFFDVEFFGPLETYGVAQDATGRDYVATEAPLGAAQTPPQTWPVLNWPAPGPAARRVMKSGAWVPEPTGSPADAGWPQGSAVAS